jgi:hypothetical protein
MPRAPKILLAVSAFVAIIVMVVILAGPSMQRSFFYPKSHDLPSVVGQATEQLLVRLQSTLDANAPAVARSLQSGLSAAELTELEARGGFRLSDDLRALYRWHDGMQTNSTVGLLPGQRFVPLAEVVTERATMQQQKGVAFRVFAGYRRGWLHVVDDGAGDGYFYDPKRTDAEGAFFQHFAEAGYYLWFPSLRNFMAGVIDCYESRAVRVTADGKNLDEDFERVQKIWERFAKSSERGD